MKFKREKIGRTLNSLKLTKHESWKDIVIDDDRLSQWPEEGDLTQTEELQIKPDDDLDGASATAATDANANVPSGGNVD